MSKKLDILNNISKDQNLDYVTRQSLDAEDDSIPDDLDEHEFNDSLEFGSSNDDDADDSVDLAADDTNFLDKFNKSKAAEEKAAEEKKQAKIKAEKERKAEEDRLRRKAEEEREQAEKQARLEAERKAEEERLAEEQRRAEEERKAEEERLKKEAEEKAEQERREAEEQARIEAEKKAEAERKAEEQRKAEERRKAEEKASKESKIEKEKSKYKSKSAKINSGSNNFHEKLEATNINLSAVSDDDLYTKMDKKILIKLVIMARDNVSIEDDFLDAEDIAIMWNRLANHIANHGEDGYVNDFTKTDKKIIAKLIAIVRDGMEIDNDLIDMEDITFVWNKLLDDVNNL